MEDINPDINPRQSTAEPVGKKPAIKKIIAMIIGAIPLVIIVIDETGLATELKLAGVMSGSAAAVLQVLRHPATTAYIARFLPWLLDESQANSIDLIVKKEANSEAK